MTKSTATSRWRAIFRRRFLPAGMAEALKISLPMALLVVAAFYVAFQFVRPAPPDHIRILSGPEDGLYYGMAHIYQKALQEHGIKADVIITAGSTDNLDRLQAMDDEDASATIAFSQAGVRPGATDFDRAGRIEALASLYYEPVWLFVRKDIPFSDLRDLAHLRVALGAGGSGSRALAETLYSLNDLSLPQSPESLLGGADAGAALLLGQVDAVLTVGGAGSQVLSDMLADESMQLQPFRRADAYARLLPYIEALTLPEGGLGLADNIPPADTQLIATTAMLVARDTVHPALVDLLLMVAGDIHDRGSLFEEAGTFPSAYKLSLPHNADAKRFLQRGPSFFQRVLPFWAATLLDRWLVMLLPLLTLLLPLARILPPLYSWRIRARITRPYKTLRDIETTTEDQSVALARLADVERSIADLSVPPTYAGELYTLKFHIRQLREKLQAEAG